MSSLITVWGTLTFPAGAQSAWRVLELDGGGDAGDGEFAAYFADEHEAVTVEEALARADEAYPFARFESQGDALHVRAALGDDYWSEWLAILGGLARSAAELGAAGTLEVEDDGLLMGRLQVSKAGATWSDAGRGDVATDRSGALAVHRIFQELWGAAHAKKRSAKKASASGRAAKKAAKKKTAMKPTTKKTEAKKKAMAKKSTAKRSPVPGRRA
jgi:hypothetical protein